MGGCDPGGPDPATYLCPVLSTAAWVALGTLGRGGKSPSALGEHGRSPHTVGDAGRYGPPPPPRLRPPQLVSRCWVGRDSPCLPSPRGGRQLQVPRLYPVRRQGGCHELGGGHTPGLSPPCAPHPGAPGTYIRSWGAGWPDGTRGAGGTWKERGLSSALVGSPTPGHPQSARVGV